MKTNLVGFLHSATMILIGVLVVIGTFSATLAEDILLPYPPDDQFGTPEEVYGLPVASVGIPPSQLQVIPPAPVLPPLVLPQHPQAVVVEEPGDVVEVFNRPTVIDVPQAPIIIEEVKVPRPGVEFIQVQYPEHKIPPAPQLPPLKLPIKVVVSEQNYAYPGREVIQIVKPVAKVPQVRESILHQNYVSVVENEPVHRDILFPSKPAVQYKKPEQNAAKVVDYTKVPFGIPLGREVVLSHQFPHQIIQKDLNVRHVIEKEIPHSLFTSKSGNKIYGQPSRYIFQEKPIVLESGAIPSAGEVVFTQNFPGLLDKDLSVVSSPFIEEVKVPESATFVELRNPNPSSSLVRELIYKDVPYSKVIEGNIKLLPSGSVAELAQPNVYLSPGHKVPDVSKTQGYILVQSEAGPQIVVEEPKSSFWEGLDLIKKSGFSFLQNIFSAHKEEPHNVVIQKI